MKPWFKIVKPHSDIQEGHLDESVFAANLTEVAEGSGRDVYTNPEIFFQKTYFTQGLKNISNRVIKGLNGGENSDNRVMTLQTGFGGGKTHTLISLFHLAKLGKSIDKKLIDLISLKFRPNFSKANIAIFTNKTNDPVQGRTIDSIKIKTIWGEIAYQLGGIEAYKMIASNDEERTAPKGLFVKILNSTKPGLILIDELADYCVSAMGVKVGKTTLGDQTISFMQELTEAISLVDNCVLISTLPASAKELVASQDAANILTALENRISRISKDLKPVDDDEIFEVVRRRLFEDLGDEKSREEVIEEYSNIYHHLYPEFPDYAVKTDYKDILRKSYPFHPELINIFRLRWASNPYFQRTRGVLRLLAAIISDLWNRQNSLSGSNYMIHTSDVYLSNIDAVVSQITSLYGPNWSAVINADVSGSSSNSFRIDSEVHNLGKYNITQGLASTILLSTFESIGQNKGISIPEIKLCMIKPDGFNHNEINSALDRIENVAHYLFYSTAGQKRYWFHTTPNINVLINKNAGEIKKDDVHKEILERIELKIKNIKTFNVLVNPGIDIPEQKNLTLIILHPKYLYSGSLDSKTKEIIKNLSTKKGNSERIYRNTILFLLCKESVYLKLITFIKDFLSCKKVKEEYRDQLKTEDKDEIKRRIDESNKLIESTLPAAYSVIVKNILRTGLEFEEINSYQQEFASQINSNVFNILKDNEWIVENVGMNLLKINNLLPEVEKPVKVKDIYEAFIQFDDKPMITGINAVQQSLLRYCMNGEFAIAAGDGKVFSKIFFKENVPFFDVREDLYWIVDKSLYKPDIPTTGMTGPSPEVDEPKVTPDTPDPKSKKTFKSITIKGSIAVENYAQIFTSFIQPLIKNKVEINIEIKGVSTSASPITETSEQYKIAKESAKQLGLKFEEE